MGPQGGPRCGVRSSGLDRFDGQLADITCQLCLRRIHSDGNPDDSNAPSATSGVSDVSPAHETIDAVATSTTDRAAGTKPDTRGVDTGDPPMIPTADPQAVVDRAKPRLRHAADPRLATTVALIVIVIAIWLLRRRR